MTPARIVFKSKIHKVYNHDDTLAYLYVSVPVFKRHHCDMNAFRSHHKYGGYANSDLFPNMLRIIKENLFPSGILRLDNIPENVDIDDSGFLATITVTIL